MATGFRDIAARLREAIERGDPPGSRIPTEHELSGQYGVSRETVRRALAVLKAAGLLSTATSQGTTVSPAPLRLAVSRYAAAADPARAGSGLGPWEAACAQLGLDGRVEMVAVVRETAGDTIAGRLDVAPGTELVHRSRRMLLGEQVAQLQDTWSPAALLEGTPLDQPGIVVGGVYAAMTAAGIELATVTEEVLARVSTSDEQATMGLDEAVPVLEVWRTTRDRSGQAVEILHTRADARRCTFVYDNLPIA
jgi:GntR family transcriptional regulator